MPIIPPNYPKPPTKKVNIVTRTWQRRSKGGIIDKFVFWMWVLVGLLLTMIFLWLIASCIDTASKNAAIMPLPSPSITSETPAPTVTPSAVPPPVMPTFTQSPSPSACPVPSEPDRSLHINQFEPASNLTWMADLEEVNRIVYAGEPATAAELRVWVNAAACNGMVAEIQPGKVSDGGSVTQTAVGTFCWEDWPLPPASECTDPSRYLPIFHPYPEPNTYGKVSAYAEVGKAATSGVAAVQAFGTWETPTDVKDKFSFPKTGEKGNSRPSAEEVAEFARLLHGAGINDILIYHEGGASNDKQYLNEVARLVRGVINQ